MSATNDLERYRPEIRDRFSFTEDQVERGQLQVEGRNVPHIQTSDFPVSDPWSKFLRANIEDLRRRGFFRGKEINEGGSGDGRNLFAAGGDVARITGIDIDRWRVGVSVANIETNGRRVDSELWVGDVTAFFKECRREGRVIKDRMIFCLPQSPQGLNHADSYAGEEGLGDYEAEWGRLGLTLNAAALDTLRLVAHRDLRTLIIFSGRIPDEVLNSLFNRTGWEVERKATTKEPIQQDPDTGISYVIPVDDGRRFFEKNPDGRYLYISALEAEKRRDESFRSGLGRRALNVYHDLTVFQLKVAE